MPSFPSDAPKARVLKVLEALGFQLVREREHIAMVRENADGTRTPLTLPNHLHIKGSTLRTIVPEQAFPATSFCRPTIRHKAHTSSVNGHKRDAYGVTHRARFRALHAFHFAPFAYFAFSRFKSSPSTGSGTRRNVK